MEYDKYAKKAGKKTAILIGALIILIIFFVILSVFLTLRKNTVLIKETMVEKSTIYR